VAAWFQYTGTDGQTYSALFGGKDSGGGTEWFIGKHSGNTNLGIQDGNYVSSMVSNPGIFDAAGRASAHSLIFTRSAASGGSYTGKVYIDGVLKRTASFTGVNSAEMLTIGKEYEGGGYPFKGKVWQALVLSKELTAADVSSLHTKLAAKQRYCTAPTCPAVAYYHQNVQPLAGGKMKDLGPRCNDGTVSGSVSASGDHLVFNDGSIDIGVSMGSLIAMSGGSGAYTVAAWFQYTGTDGQTYSALFGGKDSGGGTEWFIGKHSGNTNLGIQDGNYVSSMVSNPGIFDAAGRASAHSLIFTRSAASGGSYTGKVYIDGVLKRTASFTGVNSAEMLTIGKEYEGGGYPFKGKVWQALVLPSELDASQVGSLHSTLAAGGTYSGCGVTSASPSSMIRAPNSPVFSLIDECVPHPTRPTSLGSCPSV